MRCHLTEWGREDAQATDRRLCGKSAFFACVVLDVTLTNTCSHCFPMFCFLSSVSRPAQQHWVAKCPGYHGCGRGTGPVPMAPLQVFWEKWVTQCIQKQLSGNKYPSPPTSWFCGSSWEPRTQCHRTARGTSAVLGQEQETLSNGHLQPGAPLAA